jgi:hypothetical protein
MITRYLTDNELRNAISYIYGPTRMIKAMENLLQDDLQIPKEQKR